ncbi:MAG TPA: ATP-binding protein [Rubrivivax sp.]|nr:ATP-binding protein [Rubrivivax sp.]HPO18223.1 ATP-binding protein [Rubrivivax sp.]
MPLHEPHEPHEPVVFMPGAGGSDAHARHALRQATLRLRREVCWLWRERLLQGAADAAAADPAALPPFIDPALGVLDLARYAQHKQAFFRDDPTARHLGALIAAPAPDAGPQRRGGFGWVVRELALEPVEAFVLALALLPALDSAAGAVIATCLNDAQRGEPTLALAQRLWDEPDPVLRCFDPGHRLFAFGLVEGGGWNAPLRVAPVLARELLGLAPEFGRSSPEREARARRRVIPVLGAPGAPLAEAAAQAAARDGQPLMQAAADADAEGLRAAMTLAWLRGAALYLPCAHWAARLPADGHAHAVPPLPLPALPLSLFVGIHERASIRALGEPVLPAVEVPPPGFAERLAVWRRALPSAARRPVLAELARRFRGETAAIERIAAELGRLGREPTADELLAAARADLDLGALAQAVSPRFELQELMLPPAQTRQVAELVTAMRNLGRVHHEWGTARAWNEGGLAALFAGPPGTGKTMASEAVAHELQLPLWRIDLSQVVNKYIGETEKNLKRLFDAADGSEAILFFDEADALFGKRTEVKDAHDRYANLEISYLLERMERFKGLAILATNRRKDLDEAFLRRLRFVIEFPLPGAPERERIWRGVVPPGVDAGELDFDFLAQRFPLAGGHIRAIVFHACLQAAGEGAEKRLTMQGVVRAVQREYDKLERASSLEQFGPYAPLVAAERVAR